MTQALSQWRPLFISVIPIGFCLFAVIFDRDFCFVVPLTVLMTIVFGGLSFFANRNGRWPLYAVVGGILGWFTSIYTLMNLEI